MLENLEEQGVQILDGAKLNEVDGEKKYIKLERDSVEYRILVDSIVMAAGYKKSGSLGRELLRLAGNGGGSGRGGEKDSGCSGGRRRIRIKSRA
jgi:predicted flavoprotein YhiN